VEEWEVGILAEELAATGNKLGNMKLKEADRYVTTQVTH
jgi:hypothetical protein